MRRTFSDREIFSFYPSNMEQRICKVASVGILTVSAPHEQVAPSAVSNALIRRETVVSLTLRMRPAADSLPVRNSVKTNFKPFQSWSCIFAE